MLTELMYLLVAVIIGLCLNRNEQLESTETVSNYRNTSFETSKNYTTDLVKERLIQVYNCDNIENKREKIVGLLLQLERLEDTDIFFEEHDYIRSYIFNAT